MKTYTCKLNLEYKIWMNRGGGWELYSKNMEDIPSDIRRVLPSHLAATLRQLGSFTRAAALTDGVVGGSLDVSPEGDILVTIEADRQLDVDTLQDELAGQLSDGWGENLDGIHVTEWATPYRDYALTASFDVDTLSTPVDVSRMESMFGFSDIDGFLESVEDSITFRHQGPGMVIMSILSDAQEQLNFDPESARKTINRAKLLLDRYVTDRSNHAS